MPARDDLTDAGGARAEQLGDARLAEDLRLLATFAHDRADAPADARLVLLRWVGFPDPRQAVNNPVPGTQST